MSHYSEVLQSWSLDLRNFSANNQTIQSLEKVYSKPIGHYSETMPTSRMEKLKSPIYSSVNLRQSINQNKLKESTTLETKEITRRLQATIGIWCLPHLSKEQATDLLGSTEIGNFIVRSSTTNQNMLSLSFCKDIDGHCLHYFIEECENYFNLQGSEERFPSLTFLLTHYIENSSDLQYQLSFPSILMRCNETVLHNFNDMGESFWLMFASTLVKEKPIPALRNRSSSVPVRNQSRQSKINHLISLFENLPTEEDTLLRKPPIPTLDNQESDAIYSIPFATPISTTAAPRVVSTSQEKDILPAGDVSTIYSSPWDLQPKFKRLPPGYRPSATSDVTSSSITSSVYSSLHEYGAPMPWTPERTLNNLDRTTRADKVGCHLRNYLLQMLNGSVNDCEDLPNWIKRFTQCVIDKEDKCKTSLGLMSHIRQFLNGLRNYILISKRAGIMEAVQVEKSKLGPHEFLNLHVVADTLLLEKVLQPLRDHIYRVLSEEDKRCGALQNMFNGCKIVMNGPPEKFGIMAEHITLVNPILPEVTSFLKKMTDAFSPIVKLQYLLQACNLLFTRMEAATPGHSPSVAIEHFLPLLMYVLAQGQFVVAGIEAQFMDGLLPPSIVQAESGYYLNILLAAVEMLKAAATEDVNRDNVIVPGQSSLFSNTKMASNQTEDGPAGGNLIRVFILDELTDTILAKVFPLKCNSNTDELCNLISHRMHVYNPSAYSLYHYDNGQERCLEEQERPVLLKQEFENFHHRPCVFLYKRTNAFMIVPGHLDFN